MVGTRIYKHNKVRKEEIMQACDGVLGGKSTLLYMAHVDPRGE